MPPEENFIRYGRFAEQLYEKVDGAKDKYPQFRATIKRVLAV
jgi:hypothetical protein